ncbi:MAG: DUF5668 domain-containing protein [Limnochordia bacterium]|jgi:hypothetical protein|nr:DUF5668 domain-containing protein [Limnochordia bacterium]
MAPSRLFGGILLLFLGSILLLNNLGMLSWSIWSSLYRAWPALLILLGFSLLVGKRRSILGTILLVLLVIALGFGVFFWVFFYVGDVHEVQRSTFSDGFPGDVSEGRLHMDIPAGSLEVKAEPSLQMVNSTFSVYDQAPRWEVTRIGSVAEYSLSLPRKDWFFGGSRRAKGEVFIANQVPWHLVIKMGAGKLEADLRSAVVKSMDVDVGAGDLDIILGDSQVEASININGGVGNVTIRVPRNAGVKVISKGGITAKNFQKGLLQIDDRTWMDEGYSIAGTKYTISLNTGVAKIGLERY